MWCCTWLSVFQSPFSCVIYGPLLNVLSVRRRFQFTTVHRKVIPTQLSIPHGLSHFYHPDKALLVLRVFFRDFYYFSAFVFERAFISRFCLSKTVHLRYIGIRLFVDGNCVSVTGCSRVLPWWAQTGCLMGSESPDASAVFSLLRSLLRSLLKLDTNVLKSCLGTASATSSTPTVPLFQFLSST